MKNLTEYLKPGVFIIFGIIYLYRAFLYPSEAARWPKITGIAIILCSFAWLIEVIFSRLNLKKLQSSETKNNNLNDDKIDKTQIKTIAFCGVITLLYIISLQFFGFAISSTLYYAILANFFGTKFSIALTIGLVINLSIYALAFILSIPLPQGALVLLVKNILG